VWLAFCYEICRFGPVYEITAMIIVIVVVAQALSRHCGVDIHPDVASACTTPPRDCKLSVRLLTPPCLPEAMVADDGAIVEYLKSDEGTASSVTASLAFSVQTQQVSHALVSSAQPACTVVLSSPCLPVLRKQQYLCVVLCGFSLSTAAFWIGVCAQRGTVPETAYQRVEAW
jgi:hypothetical protein